MLQAVSLVVSLAVLLWTLGLPALNVAMAVNLTNVSDTLSDSDRGVVSNHTIAFETTTGVTNGQSIVITFPIGFNLSTSSVTFTDIDVASTTDFTLAANCAGSEHIGASISGQDLTLEFCAGDGGYISPAGSVTVRIGTNATGGVNRITNHPQAGSYELNIQAGLSDTGATRIVILDDVLVTASVDTVFDFTVSGFESVTGVNVNGTTTNATSSAIAIPFGTLTANNIKTAAQRLNVTTNAANGFVVTVFQSGDLASVTGADIDGFYNGTYENTPSDWVGPSTQVGNEWTYGHWGITSSDDLNGGEFQLCAGNATGCWVAASTTPRQIFSATSSADGLAANIGSTTVGYQVQISALQEAADDYSTTLTYIATPTF
jgi:hypothetical protein